MISLLVALSLDAFADCPDPAAAVERARATIRPGRPRKERA